MKESASIYLLYEFRLALSRALCLSVFGVKGGVSVSHLRLPDTTLQTSVP